MSVVTMSEDVGLTLTSKRYSRVTQLTIIGNNMQAIQEYFNAMSNSHDRKHYWNKSKRLEKMNAFSRVNVIIKCFHLLYLCYLCFYTYRVKHDLHNICKKAYVCFLSYAPVKMVYLYPPNITLYINNRSLVSSPLFY